MGERDSDWMDDRDEMIDLLNAANREIKRQAKRIVELEAALKPFAELAESMIRYKATAIVTMPGQSPHVTVSDARNAARVLAEKEGGGDESLQRHSYSGSFVCD